MFNYGLRRRWFPRNAIGDMKNWVEDNRESRDESYCLLEPTKSTTFGEGVLITSDNSEGLSSASVLYNYLGKPPNLIYCSLQDENTVWFVIAKDGIIYGDHIIKLNIPDESSQMHMINMLIQDIERFGSLSTENDMFVTIVCNDAKQNNDASKVVLLGKFEFETLYKVDLLNSDFNIKSLVQEESLSKEFGLELSISAKFPINGLVVKSSLASFGIVALWIFISLLPEKEAPVTTQKYIPPVVVDTFKNLKKLLTEGEEGVGIKQRFGFIVEELNAARNIDGYNIYKYTANQEASSISLYRDYGSIDAVKAKLPENIFYYQPTSGGLTAVRVTPKFPILKIAVRANSFAETAWIESALRYAWSDHIGEIKSKAAVKTKKGRNFTVHEYSIPFEGLYLEDFESMSSLFVGRSASFEALDFTVNEENKSYSGVFKFKIIGVPDEHFGIKKSKI
jgi:hypothetical protein